jgi:hypothetical protein
MDEPFQRRVEPPWNPDFGDDDWRDALDAGDPDYPLVPDWLRAVMNRRAVPRG